MSSSKGNLKRQNVTYNTNFDYNLDRNLSEQILLPFKITTVNDKNVEIDFNGGSISSDAGVLLLSEAERYVKIIKEIANSIGDDRDQSYVTHLLEEILSQRIYQIACGYEDAEDCNTLRSDPAIKVAVGRAPESDGPLASQPTMSRLENSIRRTDLMRIGYTFVENFIHSYEKEPLVIILDFDDTDNTVYGNQQESLFNGYFNEYCYMPLHAYEGLSGKLITTILRPGKRLSGKEVLSYLKRIVARIRGHWKKTVIVFRGDSHYSSPEVHEWIDEQDNLYFVTGLSSNEVLKKEAEPILEKARSYYKFSGKPQKMYHSIYYKAGSWERHRRVVIKVEVTDRGKNIRFIVTNMGKAKSTVLYERIYCDRGNMENRIKDHKIYLKSDRSSCHRFEANQFRLFLHSAAYVLLNAIRKISLKGTELDGATLETIRLKILKVGSRVVELKTKIKFHLPSSYPYKELLRNCFRIVQSYAPV